MASAAAQHPVVFGTGGSPHHSAMRDCRRTAGHLPSRPGDAALAVLSTTGVGGSPTRRDDFFAPRVVIHLDWRSLAVKRRGMLEREALTQLTQAFSALMPAVPS